MSDRLKAWLDEATLPNIKDEYERDCGLKALRALRAVVEWHREDVGNRCMACGYSWPCPTIRAIEKEVLDS